MEHVTSVCLRHRRPNRSLFWLAAPALVMLALAACGRPPEAPAVPTPTAVIAFPTVKPVGTPAAGTGATVDQPPTATPEVAAAAELTGTAAVSETQTLTESMPSAAEIRAGSEAAAAAQAGLLYFLQPTDNATVPLTFTMVISYTGLTVAPDQGQVYLLVDSDFVPAGETMPDDELHVALRGARSAQVGLPPGSHVLRLQYVDPSGKALEGDQYRHAIVVNAADGAPATGVRIVTPTDGMVVPPTFDVVMAATGLNVAPAGMMLGDAGHFHLIVDAPYVNPGEIVPADDTHFHFGKAQTRGTLTLTPGEHLIRLQYADSEHRALEGDEYRAEIRVQVEEGAPAARVKILKPADGATVSSPFTVVWGAAGLIVEQAGQSIRTEGGHLHLLINAEFLAGGELIPNDATHLHFGKGQLSTQLTLEPGEYTLRLQMANGGHLAQEGDSYRDEIKVTVR